MPAHERRQTDQLLGALNQISGDIGEIKGTLESLAGPQGRVTALEYAHNRQWWFTVAIGPILAVIHAIARKFGANI